MVGSSSSLAAGCVQLFPMPVETCLKSHAGPPDAVLSDDVPLCPQDPGCRFGAFIDHQAVHGSPADAAVAADFQHIACPGPRSRFGSTLVWAAGRIAETVPADDNTA